MAPYNSKQIKGQAGEPGKKGDRGSIGPPGEMGDRGANGQTGVIGRAGEYMRSLSEICLNLDLDL